MKQPAAPQIDEANMKSILSSTMRETSNSELEMERWRCLLMPIEFMPLTGAYYRSNELL